MTSLEVRIAGPWVMEAAPAACPVEHRAVRCSIDRDVRRLRGRTLIDPVEWSASVD